MIILILYLAPVICTLLIAAPASICLFKRLRNHSKAETEEPPLANPKESIDELRKTRPIVIHQLGTLVYGATLIFMFPIAMLRLAIAMRWGTKILWLLPFNLYELWQISFISLSYYYAKIGNIFTAATLAVLVGNAVIFDLLTTFKEKDGILNILRLPRHKVNVRGIVETGLILVLLFGAIYYIMSLANPKSFSSQLSIFDSIYFSVMTIATVGYGDIIPVTAFAKIVTIFQVLLGVLYFLFIVGIFLSVYMRNKEQEMQEKEDRS